VNSTLVARNSDGQPESVHYEMVNAMLLNEFLREHDALLEAACDCERTAKRARGKNRYGQRSGRNKLYRAASSPGPVAAEPVLAAEVLRSARALRAHFGAPGRNALRATKGQMTTYEKFAIAST
jgi:hypothetical protein